MSKIPISEFEYQMLLEKVAEKKVIKLNPPSREGKSEYPEAVLMGRIMKFCKNEGFPTQCFRPSRKAIGFLTPGWPD